MTVIPVNEHHNLEKTSTDTRSPLERTFNYNGRFKKVLGLEYAQNPEHEYKIESYNLFKDMLSRVHLISWHT